MAGYLRPPEKSARRVPCISAARRSAPRAGCLAARCGYADARPHFEAGAADPVLAHNGREAHAHAGREGPSVSGAAPARPEILILPNPWDAGTAKLLASVGFEALATTSLTSSYVTAMTD